MPLSISDSLSRVAGQVVVEVVEYLVLLVDGVKEAVEELDSFALILKELCDLAAITEVGAWNEVGEVGRCLKVDMHLEVDEVHKEFVDLSNPIMSVEHINGEGTGGKGGDGGLGLSDNIEEGGHGDVVVVVVVAGRACNWCRTGF